MSLNSNGCVWGVLAIVLVTANTCPAQQIALLDLTQIEPRVELRSPPRAPRPNGAVGSITQVQPCFKSTADAGALRTTLVSLDSTEYQTGDEPRFEVEIENIGSQSLKLPFSPHLADLQPADPSQQFVYSSLDIVLWIGGRQWSANTGGTVYLYGADSHPGSMVTLNPGESVRIIGKGNLDLPSRDSNVLTLIRRGDAVDHAFAKISLSTNERLLAPEGDVTVSREACLSQIQGRNLPLTVATGR